MQNFKYSISINQYAVITHGLDLDIIDCAIFDYIKDFAASPNSRKKCENGNTYVWVKWSKIVEDMPLLGIKTRDGINKRLKNLRDANLVLSHPDNQKSMQAWFMFGDNYSKMTGFEIVDTCISKNTAPVYENIQPCISKNTAPVYENIHNNSINNNSININTTSSSFEKIRNEKSLLSYLSSVLEVEEKEIEKITPRLEILFEEQLKIDKKQHDDFQEFRKHYITFCRKVIPKEIKAKEPKSTPIPSQSKNVRNGSKYISNFDD